MKTTHDIRVTDYDRLWMQAVYETIKKNEQPSFRKIRVKLNDQLPRDYHPDKIDQRLIGWKGTELTILGVDLIDPNAKIKEKANKVLLTIRKKIFENAEIKKITSGEIADSVNMTEAEVGFVLMLLRPFGNLNSNASHSNQYYGYSEMGLDDSNDKILEEYLYFKDVDLLIDESLRKKKEREEQGKFAYPIEASEPLSMLAGSSKHGIAVNPIFTSRAQKNPTICFVLMPFTQPWSSDVFGNIKTLVESFGYQCLRADNQSGRVIIEDIWVGIIQAAFIIADVTGPNPNVMYELGIADTVGTPVTLITQEIDKIPFDFKHYRHAQYQNTINGWKPAEEAIKKTIEGLKRNGLARK